MRLPSGVQKKRGKKLRINNFRQPRCSQYAVSVLVCLLVAGLPACVTSDAPIAVSDKKPGTPGSRAIAAAAAVVDQDEAAPPEESAATVFEGNDETVSLPAPKPPVRLDGDAVMLNFEQAPLSEVVHSILGETLDLDYVIEHPVNGEVTLRTRSPIPRDQLLPILESLLQNNGVLMIRGPNDRFFVSGSPNARSTVPSYVSADSKLAGFSNVIIPLQYISANEMAEILKPVAPQEAFVRIDAARNLMVLAGTQVQLQGWLDIVGTFDVDQLAGKSVGIFPLNNSTVDEVYEELQHILSSGDGDVTGIASLVRVMPVDRLNSILVVSPRAYYIERVREWVERLDSVDDPASEPTLHVYPVKNGNAGQLASLLSTIYGGGGGGSAASRAGQRSVAPGMTSTGGGDAAPASGQRTGGAAAGGGSFQIGDNIRVVSDDYNNALLVYAAPYEYNKIRKTLEKLDVVATQVLIEASIVEVTLTDDLRYGLEWTFNNGIGSSYDGVGTMDLGSGLGALAPGFSYTVTNNAGAVRAVLNTLAQDSLINVISTPSVMVLDNHTASIQVGDQQPIQNQQVVTNGGNVQNSITFKDTGVQLSVTPSVNDGGLVTMDIEQSVTDVGPVDAATGQRSFLNRNVNSRVAIRSGESVVLGGLIRDNSTTGRNGIPLLMDIPVLGNLFSTTTDSQSRTELLVLITPRVLESDQDLRDLNREMRNRMKGLKRFEDLPVSFGERDASK